VALGLLSVHVIPSAEVKMLTFPVEPELPTITKMPPAYTIDLKFQFEPPGVLLTVHVTASVEVATVSTSPASTYTLLPYVTELIVALVRTLRLVHVIASVDVLMTPELPTDTNNPLPYVQPLKFCETAEELLVVHTIPSSDVLTPLPEPTINARELEDAKPRKSFEFTAQIPDLQSVTVVLPSKLYFEYKELYVL